MLTTILRRNAEPNIIQLTQEIIVGEMSKLNRSEMLTEDSWAEGLKKVRTPFVCLLEADCVLSSGYFWDALEPFREDGHNPEKGTGGYTKLAVISPVVGVESFTNRIYGYGIEGDEAYPKSTKDSDGPYHVQIGYVPGAIMRYASIKNADVDWDNKDLVRLSAEVCLELWNTGRRVQINPAVTYVSSYYLVDAPCLVNLPGNVQDIFKRGFPLSHNLRSMK